MKIKKIESFFVKKSKIKLFAKTALSRKSKILLEVAEKMLKNTEDLLKNKKPLD